MTIHIHIRKVLRGRGHRILVCVSVELVDLLTATPSLASILGRRDGGGTKARGARELSFVVFGRAGPDISVERRQAEPRSTFRELLSIWCVGGTNFRHGGRPLACPIGSSSRLTAIGASRQAESRRAPLPRALLRGDLLEGLLRFELRGEHFAKTTRSLLQLWN